MSDNNDQYNRGGLIAFVFSMAFCFVFFVYIVAFHPGVELGENLQDPPSQAAAEEAKVDVSKITEPWVANADMVKHGTKLFAQNCAMCHGNQGKGDGPAGMGLNPRPRNLVDGPWKVGGGYLGWFKVVTEGIPGTSMAAYKHFSTTDRWALVQFIDSITKAKVATDAAKVAEFAKTAK